MHLIFFDGQPMLRSTALCGLVDGGCTPRAAEAYVSSAEFADEKEDKKDEKKEGGWETWHMKTSGDRKVLVGADGKVEGGGFPKSMQGKTRAEVSAALKGRNNGPTGHPEVDSALAAAKGPHGKIKSLLDNSEHLATIMQSGHGSNVHQTAEKIIHETMHKASRGDRINIARAVGVKGNDLSKKNAADKIVDHLHKKLHAHNKEAYKGGQGERDVRLDAQEKLKDAGYKMPKQKESLKTGDNELPIRKVKGEERVGHTDSALKKMDLGALHENKEAHEKGAYEAKKAGDTRGAKLHGDAAKRIDKEIGNKSVELDPVRKGGHVGPTAGEMKKMSTKELEAEHDHHDDMRHDLTKSGNHEKAAKHEAAQKRITAELGKRPGSFQHSLNESAKAGEKGEGLGKKTKTEKKEAAGKEIAGHEARLAKALSGLDVDKVHEMMNDKHGPPDKEVEAAKTSASGKVATTPHEMMANHIQALRKHGEDVVAKHAPKGKESQQEAEKRVHAMNATGIKENLKKQVGELGLEHMEHDDLHKVAKHLGYKDEQLKGKSREEMAAGISGHVTKPVSSAQKVAGLAAFRRK